MTAGSVSPISTRLTDADYRRLVAATVGRLCLVHGKDRLALEAGCDERTMRHARDERTSLSAASLFNMLALDASALDELASHFGLKLVALEASDKAEGELLTGTLALAHGHAAALADGKICHIEEQTLATLARPVVSEWAARIARADRKRA
jgi:hypothetical protein